MQKMASRELGKLKEEKSSGMCIIISEAYFLHQLYTHRRYILRRISGEQILVWHLIAKYNATCKENINLLCGKTQFTELDDEMQVLVQMLKDIEPALEISTDIIRSYMERMNEHFGSLVETSKKIREAKDSNDLDKITIPTMDWIQSFLNPEVESLEEQWEEMSLLRKMSDIFHQLTDLVGMVDEAEEEEDVVEKAWLKKLSGYIFR